MIEKLEHIQRLVFKARNDLRSAQDLMQTASPATDVVCFHCQQAAEKMLKAWLHWHEITVPRTHNLAEIVELCERTDPAFSQLQGVEILTPYAVEVRYVDDFYFPPLGEALGAVELAEQAERFVLSRFEELGIDPIKNFLDDYSPA